MRFDSKTFEKVLLVTASPIYDNLRSIPLILYRTEYIIQFLAMHEIIAMLDLLS